MRLQWSLLLLLAVPLSAQTFEQTAFLRIVPQTMSVRGAAMGAVSTDDPSLNPASIASIKQPLFSLAAAQSSFHVTRFDFQNNTVIPSREGIDATSLSHVYAAIPVRNFVVGAYYRAEPRIDSGMIFAEGGLDPFDDSMCQVTCMSFLMLDGSPAFVRDEKSYGLSAAWERGPLAIGIGAEMKEVEERYQLFRLVFAGGSPTIPQDSRNDAIVRTAEGRDVVPHAGIRWTVSPKLAVAGAYNGGASFSRRTEICSYTPSPDTGCTTRMAELSDTALKTASSWRASVTFTPYEKLQLVGEAVRRNYSDLSQEPYSVGSVAVLTPYRDATELHLGAEYRLRRVTLRAGWWRDPGRYREELSPYFIHPLTGDSDHRTFGLGVDLGGRTRLDLALDDADDPSLRRASAGITLAAF